MIKYRCPAWATKVGRTSIHCSYDTNCSKSAYGRTFYIYPKSNYRLFISISRRVLAGRLTSPGEPQLRDFISRLSLISVLCTQGSHVRGAFYLAFYSLVAALFYHSYTRHFVFNVHSLTGLSQSKFCL